MKAVVTPWVRKGSTSRVAGSFDASASFTCARVDEAGRDDQPRRIDGPDRGARRLRTDIDDPLAANGDVAAKGGGIAGIDRPAAQQEIGTALRFGHTMGNEKGGRGKKRDRCRGELDMADHCGTPFWLFYKDVRPSPKSPQRAVLQHTLDAVDAAGAVGREPQRPVEVDEGGARRDDQRGGDRQRGRNHAAGHHAEPRGGGGIRERKRAGQAARFVELDVDDLIFARERPDIARDMRRSIGGDRDERPEAFERRIGVRRQWLFEKVDPQFGEQGLQPLDLGDRPAFIGIDDDARLRRRRAPRGSAPRDRSGRP